MTSPWAYLSCALLLLAGAAAPLLAQSTPAEPSFHLAARHLADLEERLLALEQQTVAPHREIHALQAAALTGYLVNG